MQKYIQEHRHDMILQNSEATLMGYLQMHHQFPLPEEPISHENGVMKGMWPAKALGKTPLVLEYYVDERVVKGPMKTLRAFYDNRMTLVESSEMIPFILKIKDKMTYMNNITLMAKYFPRDLDTPFDTLNDERGPEFQP